MMETRKGLEIDDTTYADLSLFSNEEEYSLFHKLNFTRTRGGMDQLLDFFNHPFGDKDRINETQRIISLIAAHSAEWPLSISNGTIMVMERFYETAVDTIPEAHNLPGALAYKIFHAPDYSLVRYTVGHFADFVRGMHSLIQLLSGPGCPALLASLLQRAERLLDHEILHSLAKREAGARLNPVQVIYYGHYTRMRFKTAAMDLIDIYNRLDAWYSMAMAMERHHLSFPVFVDEEGPFLEADGMYHLLLPAPASYDVRLDRDSNFLFLTGANMAGKSTFIRSVGVAVFLAHLGMGVPAASLRLSLFDGILSNINVMDNISKGE